MKKFIQYKEVTDIYLFDSKGYEKSQGFDHNLIKNIKLNKELMIAGNIQYDDELRHLNKIADFVDLSGGLETSGLKDISKIDVFLDKVKKVLKIAKEPISLETPVGDEEDSSLGDFIEDKNALIPIEAAVKSSLRDTTTSILSSLTPREERVLRMRFGIGMNSDHTLEEVGQQFSVTRERIRQIEAKALRKLKHPTRARKLKTFLDE